MGFIQRVGATYAAPTPSSVTVTITSAVTTAGSLVAAVAFGNQAGSVTSVTDTAGNLWVQDYPAPVASTGLRGLELWRCASTRAIPVSGTITVTCSATQDHGIAVIVEQFTFLGKPDVTNFDAGNATSGSVAVVTSATDVLVYSAANLNGAEASFTIGGAFTASGSALLTGSNPGTSAQGAYDASPSGTVTASWSWPTAHTYVLVAAAYPVGVATPPRQIPPTSVYRRPARKRPRAKIGASAGSAGGPPPGPLPLTSPVIPVTAVAVPATISGNVSIVQQVSGTSTYDYGLSTVNLTTTAGNTLVVLAGWDLSTSFTDAAMPAAIVTDSAGNYWYHVTTSTSAVTGSRCTAWFCPDARPITWLSVSLTTFASSLAYTVLEMANMPLYYSLDVAAANAAGQAASLDVNPGAASVAGIAFSVLTAGATALSPATPPGWTALPAVTSGAGAANPVQIFPYWMPVSAGTSAQTSYTVAHSVPLSGVTFSVKASPPVPVQPNPNFPLLKVEAGFGYVPGDVAQAPPTWTDITSRLLSKSDTEPFIAPAMGRDYELASVESGEMELDVDNHDGAFTPGNTASSFYPDVVVKTPIHVSAFWGTQWYHVAYGYVERWPQTWPDLPQWGISKVVATDAISVMASDTLESALDGDMLLDNPYVFIQASEEYTTFAGGINPTFSSADAQGLLAANTSRINQRAGLYVNGTAANADTGQAANMLGDSDPGFGTSSISSPPTAPSSGPGMIYTDPGLPSPQSANGVSAEFWVIIPAVVSSVLLEPVVFSAFGPASQYSTAHPSLQVQINSNGAATLTVTLADGATVTAPFATSANAQQIVLTVTTSALAVYVNGGLATTVSLTAAQTTAWHAVTLGCCTYAYASGGLVTGNFTAFDLAIYRYQLPVQRILSHYVTGFSGQQGVDATTRLAQVLAWANLGFARAGQTLFSGITDGVGQGPAYSLTGSTASDQVNQLAFNHAGLAAAAPSGALVFFHRWALFNKAPVVTFGDSNALADGEVPYGPGQGWDYDDTYLFNVGQITRQVGPNNTITVTSQDFASQHAYFTRSALQQTIQTMSDLDAYSAASWAIAKYSQPSLRVAEIVIDAAANPARAFPAVLSIQQGDVATVTRRPVGGAVISQQVIVQKISHSIGPAHWQTTMQLSPYTPENAVLTLDSPGYDDVGGNSLA